MPAYRQPLRQRCKINLTVNTSLHDCDEERGRTRSRAKTWKRTHTPDSLFSTSGTAPSSPRRAIPDEEPQRKVFKSFYHFIPHVSFAFADGDYDPFTVQYPPSGSRYDNLGSPSLSIPFTHIIRILHPSSSSELKQQLETGMVWPEYDEGSGIALLNVVIPEIQLQSTLERKFTFLDANQLLLARDFLCLALPFYRVDQQWHRTLATSSDDVHVLITAPWPSQALRCFTHCKSGVPLPTPTGDSPFRVAQATRRATAAASDVLAMVASYLAMCSGRRVRKVMRGVDEDMVASEQDGMKNVFLWKDRLNTECCAFLDTIAWIN
ncbi:hypothetical protein NLJ89_g2015 [Agrocybe chaxingu]|uniref:Uncharacterized protein n=1 Tax=Agrocybe chaxingu TaxID=84603 RepID=A0A9W8K7E6_9AGAR|nr:hypothetical protein NLJ89_g2015 [Agrocybe chaxingu]